MQLHMQTIKIDVLLLVALLFKGLYLYPIFDTGIHAQRTVGDIAYDTVA